MRIPYLKEHLMDDRSQSEEVVIDIPEEEYQEDPRVFTDKKLYGKWMETEKKIIRSSFEYIDLISFIKRKQGLDHCGVHPHLSIQNGFRIEAHHTPFTLQDIVDTVVHRRLKVGDSLDMQRVAREVMEIHYLDIVGLYPLCMICHALAHDPDGEGIFIPNEKLHGYPEKFVELYYDYMTENLRAKWTNLVALEKSYKLIKKTLPIELQKKYIYVKPIETREESVISTKKLMNFIASL